MRYFLRWVVLSMVASTASMATAQLIDLGATASNNYPNTGFPRVAAGQYPTTPHSRYTFSVPAPPTTGSGSRNLVERPVASAAQRPQSYVPPPPVGYGTKAASVLSDKPAVAEADPVPNVASPEVKSIVIPQQGSVDMGATGSHTSTFSPYGVPKGTASLQPMVTPSSCCSAPSMGAVAAPSCDSGGCDSTGCAPAATPPSCDAAPAGGCAATATVTPTASCDGAGLEHGSIGAAPSGGHGCLGGSGGGTGGLLGSLMGGSGGSCGARGLKAASPAGTRGAGTLNLPNLGNRIANNGSASCQRWFGGLYYLSLWRDDDSFGTPLAVSSATTTPVLSTGMARMENANGVGARIGRMLSSNTAIEGVYWQAFPDDPHAVAQSSTVGANINSLLSFAGVEHAGAPVDDLYQDSPYQEVSRSYEFRNFEVNFLRMPYSFQGGRGPVRLALLAGARYFNANDCIDYFADGANEVRGDDALNEISWVNKVKNHMVGFQVGGLMNYCLSDRLSGQFGSKFGLFNNRMDQELLLGGDAGGAVITAGPNAGQSFALTSRKNDVAFLAEFDAGLAWCITPAWRLTGGYKVLAVSGYADSINQFPNTFTSLVDAAEIKNNNSLILHGIYAGIEYAW